jgi:hypothetical protein
VIHLALLILSFLVIAAVVLMLGYVAWVVFLIIRKVYSKKKP